MELQSLTKRELTELFLIVHGRYLAATNTTYKEYRGNPVFAVIERELNEVLNELQRRRENKL